MNEELIALDMTIGYFRDNEPPKTLAGCHERIRNMLLAIEELRSALAPKEGA